MKIAIFTILAILPNGILCQNGTQAKALRKQIFETQEYDKKILPADDQTDATGNVCRMSFQRYTSN